MKCNIHKLLLRICCLVAGFALSSLSAQDGDKTPSPEPVPQSIKLSEEEGNLIDDLVVPIPLEIFASLNELGEQEWGKRINFRSIKLNPNRSRTALIFGHIVSEGFIAVQAQDKGAVRRIGIEVIKLAEGLGVSTAVEKHAHAIENAAYSNRWRDVRIELDKTRQTVLDKMEELRDDELASLVSLGGWIGGTEVLSEVLSENYSKEGSDLLNQPGLIEQLLIRFENLPPSSKRGSFFLMIEETLGRLQQLMAANEEGIISQENIQIISKETEELVDAIYRL